MKRAIMVICMMLIFHLSYSQTYLDARSLCIYKGHPKQLVMSTPQGEMTYNFNYDGLITSISFNGNELRYTWQPDGKRVTLKEYMGGEFVSVNYANIVEYSDDSVKYEVYNMNVNIDFDSKGRLDIIECSDTNGTMRTDYIYNGESSIPDYLEVSNHLGQSFLMALTVQHYDEYGNALEWTSEANNGEYSEKNIRKIYYY